MAAWDSDAATQHPLDFRLVQNSFVTMYCRSSLLDEAVEELQSLGYAIVIFDAGSWDTKATMLTDVAAGLSFPGYFGHNLDALNDCLSDVASGGYGCGPDDTGLVVVLKSFDAFASVDRGTAQTLLDIVVRQARNAILTGNRLICLVQSNDPQLILAPVGAMPVVWNDAEWQDSNRRDPSAGD